MRVSFFVLGIVVVSLLSSSWTYDENALRNCLCVVGCSNEGWLCGVVSCTYYPHPSSSSPACEDVSKGPCKCEGFGCGRAPQGTVGREYEQCLFRYAQPVCGNGLCETHKGENCETCGKDCGCGSIESCNLTHRMRDERGCVYRCAGVSCAPICEGNVLKSGGRCNPTTGACEYAQVTSCASASQCNAQTGKCIDEHDKCKGVVCAPLCEGSVVRYEGTCNSKTGACEYRKNVTCATGCTRDGRCGGTIRGIVFVTDTVRNASGERLLLKDMELCFVYHDPVTPSSFSLRDRSFCTATDHRGEFSWYYPPGFHPEGTIDVILIFNNSRNHFYLSYDETPSLPLSVFFAKGIRPSDRNLTYFEIDLVKTPLQESAGLKSVGKIYARMHQALEFKESALVQGPTVRERVRIFSREGTWHLTESLDEKYPGKTGTTIKVKHSDYFFQGSPTNREFHEYCHHIQSEAWSDEENKRVPPGEDHGGVSNPTSEWGLIEGWAEFCALAMKSFHGMGFDGTYEVGATTFNIELNYEIRSPSHPTIGEELAIAGILYDLHDTSWHHSTKEDDEDVSLPLRTIWKAFSEKKDFDGNGTVRHVRTLYDFYRALRDLNDTTLMRKSSRRNVSNLDDVFILHGAYQDTNENGVWDEGEHVGYSGKGKMIRTDLEPEPGTYIDVVIVDQKGNRLNESVMLVVNVSVTKDGTPALSYSYTQYLPPDGKIALPLPPEKYDAQITVVALQAGTNRRAKDVFRITAEEIRKTMNPSRVLATYTTKIETTDTVYCTNDYECIQWAAGNVCDHKTKTCKKDTALPEFESRAAPPVRPLSSSDTSTSPLCCVSSLLPLLVMVGGASYTYYTQHSKKKGEKC